MKNKNYLFILLPWILISCNTETDYKFQVKNTTPYNLDKIQLNGRNGIIINVGPYGISDPFVITRKNSPEIFFIFSEPQMVITVIEFSDSVSKYVNNIGEVISIGELKSDEINTLTFSLDKKTTHITKRFTVHSND